MGRSVRFPDNQKITGPAPHGLRFEHADGRRYGTHVVGNARRTQSHVGRGAYLGRAAPVPDPDPSNETSA